MIVKEACSAKKRMDNQLEDLFNLSKLGEIWSLEANRGVEFKYLERKIESYNKLINSNKKYAHKRSRFTYDILVKQIDE